MSDPVAGTTPRVSVISAWHNRSDDLEASIRSVLDQEGVDFEYIVVDDASTDGSTRARLQAIEHPRLRLVLCGTNVGFTRAMREAASLARGEFIAIHDAGDISHPGRLAAQVAFLDAQPDHVLVGTRVENHVLTTGERHIVEFRLNETRGVGGLIFTHGEVMFRRADYEAVGGYRPIFYYSQDNDLWRRLAERGKLGHVDELLYERRIFTDGVMGNARKEMAQAIFANLALVAEQARAAGRPDPVEERHALALLEQPLTERFQVRGTAALKRLLRERRLAEAREALGLLPAELMTWKMLAIYMLLRMSLPKPAGGGKTGAASGDA